MGRTDPDHSRRINTARLAEIIANDFYEGHFDLSARGMASGDMWSRMPEVECVQQLRALGVSDRTVRLFVTFASAMDRARDSTRLWRAGVKLLELHPAAFEPPEVSAIPFDALLALQAAGGVSQRHRKDAEAWHRIAGSLSSGIGPVCRLIDRGAGDAEEVAERPAEYRPCGSTPISDATRSQDRADVGADHGKPGGSQDRPLGHHSRRRGCSCTSRYREPGRGGHERSFTGRGQTEDPVRVEISGGGY